MNGGTLARVIPLLGNDDSISSPSSLSDCAFVAVLTQTLSTDATVKVQILNTQTAEVVQSFNVGASSRGVRLTSSLDLEPVCIDLSFFFPCFSSILARLSFDSWNCFACAMLAKRTKKHTNVTTNQQKRLFFPPWFRARQSFLPQMKIGRLSVFSFLSFFFSFSFFFLLNLDAKHVSLVHSWSMRS